jgi:hypothetical protein
MPGQPVKNDDLLVATDGPRSMIATFKPYYFTGAMQQQIAKTDDEYKPSVRKFWKGYNNKKAIDRKHHGMRYLKLESMVCGRMYDHRAYTGAHEFPK